jgi:hypothetical protein
MRSIVFSILLAIAFATAAGADDLSSLKSTLSKNPHQDIACESCHATTPVKGKTTWKETLSTFRKDPVSLCYECHPAVETAHHPVNKGKGRELTDGLPLSAEGNVICSTCHNFHQEYAGNALLRGFDNKRYSVRMDMCLDCHGKDFQTLNPHLADADSGKCYTCHVTKPKAGDTSATVATQDKLNQTCDFCHNVRGKSHPMNVDPLKGLPPGLPHGRKGELICGTCHDPHGTPDTLHFLRREYVDSLESGRYFNPHIVANYRGCTACHGDVSKDPAVMRNNRRYGGDDLMICLSCHGTMEPDHPVMIRIGADMKPGKELPLTKDGKITCLTCHDPTPCNGTGMRMRGRRGSEAGNSICFQCHDKADLSERNPHTSMSDRNSCKFCHDTMTDPKNEEAARVSFISNTRLICLRCHPQDKHPTNANHMVEPRHKLPAAFKLDAKGKITCTTCHNPHIDVLGKGTGGKQGHRYVVDLDGPDLCRSCHKR